MKKPIAVTLLLLTHIVAFTQQQKETNTKQLSNAEVFSERSGTLIRKDYTDIGTLQKCKIQVAAFTDLISGAKNSAVRFEYVSATTYASTKIGVIDADELDGMIKSMSIIQDKVLTTTPSGYSEVTYRSRSGVEAGCYVQPRNNKWAAYLKLERYDQNSFVYLSESDVPELLRLLQQARQKLI